MRSRLCSGFVMGLAALAFLLAATPRSIQADEPKDRPRRIALLAGDPDGHPPETHEYARSARLIAACLQQGPAAVSFEATVHLGGWPKQVESLDAADTIVFLTSGSDHREADHPLLVDDRLPTIEKQMRRGSGLVMIHYSTFAPERIAPRILEWTGGYFDYQTGPGGGWYSKIQTWQADVRPAAPDHPICRGVRPFQIQEEFYYKLRFQDDDPRRTSILVTQPPNETGEFPVAWAVERKNGGRGFGCTGGHFFRNWQNDDYRRALLNAIVWSAHGEVPAEGVASKFSAADALKDSAPADAGTSR